MEPGETLSCSQQPEIGPHMNSVHILTSYFSNIHLTYPPVYNHLSSEEGPMCKSENKRNYYMAKHGLWIYAWLVAATSEATNYSLEVPTGFQEPSKANKALGSDITSEEQPRI
jgi:hypothetical protein